jgi:hypothetical protein
LRSYRLQGAIQVLILAIGADRLRNSSVLQIDYTLLDPKQVDWAKAQVPC